jgi:4-hydroxy-3-polyprenylbenzoate decarboxylase
MPYTDLREFIEALEKSGELVRVKAEVDPRLEVTEILNRLLATSGPAVLFERVKGSSIPLLANLFGTVKRVAMGLETDEAGLEEIGKFLAFLQHPEPPKGFVDAIKHLPFYGRILHLAPKTRKSCSLVTKSISGSCRSCCAGPTTAVRRSTGHWW